MTSSSDDISITLIIQSSREDDEYSHMKISKYTDIGTLKLLIEAQCNVPVQNQLLVFKNAALSNDSQTLAEIGVTDNDPLIVRKTEPSSNTQTNNTTTNPNTTSTNPTTTNNPFLNLANQLNASRPMFGPNAEIPKMPGWMNMDPETMQQSIISDPERLRQIEYSNPRLATLVKAFDVNGIRQYQAQSRAAFQQQVLAEQARRQHLNDDMFNPEAQMRIEQEINQEQIDHNYQNAVEHMPESFGRVVMLYVPMEVEGQQVNAFIDSGAQTTIMSEDLAKRCGIMRLVDKRFQGIAKGVGTAKIVGRVHMAKLKFGNTYLPCSFTIMSDPDMEFLFGLDMLRRHQAIINLPKNCLMIGDESVPFLAEKDIPHLRAQAYQDVEMTEMSQRQNQQNQTPLQSRANTNTSSSSTSSTTQPRQGQQQSTQQSSSSSALEENVQTLVTRLNCTRAQAVEALRVTGGNVEMAASVLFQMMGGLF